MFKKRNMPQQNKDKKNISNKRLSDYKIPHRVNKVRYVMGMTDDEKKYQKKQVDNNKKSIFLVTIVVVCLLCLGIKLFLDYQPKKVEEEVKDYVQIYHITRNGLSDFDLYFLQNGDVKKNMIYSPLAIKYTLSMLSDGTRGKTKSQIDKVLGNYTNNKYVGNNHMSFANVMFINSLYKNLVSNDYSNNIKDKYAADIIYDDFKTNDDINSIISNKTFSLVNNAVTEKDIKDANYLLVNGFGINMKWGSAIQATCGNEENRYLVKFAHESYNARIDLFCNEMYHKLLFNNYFDVKSLQIGATINNYDLVNTVGEDKIRKMVNEKYKEWLETEDGKNSVINNTNIKDMDSYLNQYIQDLKNNYQVIKKSTDFSYYTDDDIIVFAKDLENNDTTTLQYVAIMPVDTKLDIFINDLDAKKIDNILGNLKDLEIDNFNENYIYSISGYIPIFKYDYELGLKDNLKQLDITRVFDKDKASLVGITSDNDAYLKDVLHKNAINFSNDGKSLVADASNIETNSTNGGFDYLYDVPIKSIQLNFDKPYLYLIRDKESGEVWFVGTIYRPLLIN